MLLVFSVSSPLRRAEITFYPLNMWLRMGGTWKAEVRLADVGEDILAMYLPTLLSTRGVVGELSSEARAGRCYFDKALFPILPSAGRSFNAYQARIIRAEVMSWQALRGFQVFSNIMGGVEPGLTGRQLDTLLRLNGLGLMPMGHGLAEKWKKFTHNTF
ncbi:hypothetical protein FNV43_RR17289 [Rhamnella rubrinervis]|uniref:Uncharacterized protein n=1 Tax=Rhamnella rubrinervis TaxID=2594499 RepID=A0A8K0GUP5_9ROSA|nr:hypothetical protein FNV43_RR17289 [Rhamnella rubrinervis]